MILAGDIGGTKTLVALFEHQGDQVVLVREQVFPSQEHRSLEEILGLFLHGETTSGGVKAACFGVAGPVLEGKSQATNLAWKLEETSLSTALRGAPVKLLNDLEAMAYGMLYLQPDQLKSLNPGAQPPRRGNRAVIAAGTGLGEAMLYWDGRRHHPVASEGGHTDFAPRTDQEIDLLRYLRDRFGHVSYERILSGPGIQHVFDFLRDTTGRQPTAPLAEQLAAGGDPSVAITHAGLAGEDPLCVETLTLFATLYGAEAGNLALKCVAVGGVFVGGGIAPKILPVLEGGAFLKGFVDKGRFRPLLEALPIQVALEPRAGLLGAAHYAAGMA
jgi:glucokinase